MIKTKNNLDSPYQFLLYVMCDFIRPDVDLINSVADFTQSTDRKDLTDTVC